MMQHRIGQITKGHPFLVFLTSSCGSVDRCSYPSMIAQLASIDPAGSCWAVPSWSAVPACQGRRSNELVGSHLAHLDDPEHLVRGCSTTVQNIRRRSSHEQARGFSGDVISGITSPSVRDNTDHVWSAGAGI